MIDEAQVRIITKKVLDEEHLLGYIKIFEKEHNLFRGSHDRIQLPAALNIPDQIINQIVEKFDTQLTEGSIPFIDEDNHFTELNDVFFYDEAKEILCLGLNSPETDMVGGYIVKEGTPPTQDIADCFQAYAMDTPLERLTDGELETWASATDLTNWTEFKAGAGSVDREASEVHGGTYSCKLSTVAGGDYCGFQQDLILNPGYNCRIAIWYIRTAHAGSNLRLYLYDDGPNVYLQDDGTWDAASNFFNLPVAETWTLFELEFVAHANYTNYTVKIYEDHTSGGAVSFYVDDISVSENRNVVPYFRTEAGLVIGLNQDLRTSASVIFAGLTLTGFDGILKAVDGVVTEGADHVDLANITSDQHHAQAHTLASHTTKPHSALTDVTSGQHHAQLHGPSHHSGGGDAILLDNLASPDDNTDLNASTSKHGLCVKLGGGATNFLRADGTWAAPPSTDEKVKVDSGATTGYLGAAFNDGVLRSAAPLTYVDGGNFVTLGLDSDYIYFDKDTEHVALFGFECGKNLAGGGTYNYLFGEQAGYSLTTGDDNIAIGFQALYNNVIGTKNIAIGYKALYGGVGSAIANVAIGWSTGESITTGTRNVFIGAYAGKATVVGGGNMYIGYAAGYLNIGSNNLAIGSECGAAMTAASNNALFGYKAGYSITTGNENFALGSSALYYNKTGTKNVVIGFEAAKGVVNNSCSENVLIGYQSGISITTGRFNLGVGYHSLYFITSGQYNIGIGRSTTGFNSSGNYNIGIGNYALLYNETGTLNVCIGEKAGRGVGSNNHSNNVFIGASSGYSVTTGGNNALIGFEAGYNLTAGAGNVVIGYQTAKGQLTTGNNQLWIANTNTATPLIYGEFDNEVILFNTTKIGFHKVTPVVRQAHIVDADGTLADITTKYNSLLSYLEAYGLLATS